MYYMGFEYHGKLRMGNVAEVVMLVLEVLWCPVEGLLLFFFELSSLIWSMYLSVCPLRNNIATSVVVLRATLERLRVLT